MNNRDAYTAVWNVGQNRSAVFGKGRAFNFSWLNQKMIGYGFLNMVKCRVRKLSNWKTKEV